MYQQRHSRSARDLPPPPDLAALRCRPFCPFLNLPGKHVFTVQYDLCCVVVVQYCYSSVSGGKNNKGRFLFCRIINRAHRASDDNSGTSVYEALWCGYEFRSRRSKSSWKNSICNSCPISSCFTILSFTLDLPVSKVAASNTKMTVTVAWQLP